MPRLLRATLVAFFLLPAVAAQAAPVVVSEFRFRGPDGGNDEFIELRNTTAVAQSIGGWLVQGCNSGGTVGTRATIPAGVSLPAGGSYLLVNTTAPGYSGSVPGDQTYGTGIADNGGIRLVDNATPGVVQDAVGSFAVIASAGCREGGGLTNIPTANGDNSFERIGGTQDTNDNAADFTGPKESHPQNGKGGDAAPSVASSNPANGASDVGPGASITVTFSEPVTLDTAGFGLACGGVAQPSTTTQGSPTTATVDPSGDLPRGESCTLTIAAGAVHDTDSADPPDAMANDARITFSTEGLLLRIHEIQGAAHISPYDDRTVADVPGVVTALTGNGFWFQDTAPDADPATSEGVFVFTSSNPRTNPLITVGAPVKVTGTVDEFRPGGSGGLGNLTTTEIVRPRIAAGTAGAGVSPTTIGTGPGAILPPTEIIENEIGDVETPGFLFDPEQDGIDWHESLEGMLVSIEDPDVVGPTTSNEELAVLASGFGSPRTERGGILMRAGDFNPERIILDDAILLSRQPQGVMPLANVGDTLDGPVEAVVDYSFGNPKYLVTEVPIVNDNGLQPEVTDAPRANQLAMASMNVENLDSLESQEKFDRLAAIVVHNLRSPDILAVEEMQDNDGAVSPSPTKADVTFRRFIETIAAQGGPTYEYRQIDPNSNTDGGEPNGNIRVGFLYRTDTGVEFVDRPGGTANNETEVEETRKGARLTFSPGRLLADDQPEEDPSTFASSRK